MLSTPARPQDARSSVQCTCTCLWVQPMHTFEYTCPRHIQGFNVRASEASTHARSRVNMHTFSLRVQRMHLCVQGVHLRVSCTRCHRWHLHQSRGRLGAWVSRGNQPLIVIIGSVSTYPLLWPMTPVPVIVCRHLPPSAPSVDVPVTSTYTCVFWTLLPPSI